MINELKILGESKIHLTMKVNFMSSKDNGDKQFMDAKSGNIEIIIVNKADDIIN